MSKLNSRLYPFLTTLEAALLGIPILRARSLDAGGYSLPRLLLLAAWVSLFALCVWTLARRPDSLLKFLQSRSATRAWLVVLAELCFGGVALFFLQPGFLLYFWNSLPALLEQYWLALLILGVWSLQTAFALRGAPLFFPPSSVFPAAFQVFLLAFFLYAETAVLLNLSPYSTTAYFPELAEAFLDGRADLANPPATKDLTFFDGKYYVSFPPLGALLALPRVAWRGAGEFHIVLFNVFFASLGVAFSFLALEALRARGLSRLSPLGAAALALFLGFGSSQYPMALRGLVNFTSQILTTAFLALALWFAARAQSGFKTGALLAGGALALAVLSRPNVVFAWFALAGLKFQNGERSLKRVLQWGAYSSLPVLAAFAGLFWYNQIRFGSPFDFGYEYMLVAKFLAADLARYGQFHPHFIPENFYDNFLRLPYFDERCGVWTFSVNGTSVFLVSPLLLYLFVPQTTGAERPSRFVLWRAGAWLSIALIALTHLLYYNSGALQVGYRFSLDFLPVALLLLAANFKDRIPFKALALIAVSLAVNFLGVLWTLHRWCENF